MIHPAFAFFVCLTYWSNVPLTSIFLAFLGGIAGGVLLKIIEIEFSETKQVLFSIETWCWRY